LTLLSSSFRDDCYEIQTILAVVIEAFLLEVHFRAAFYLAMKLPKQNNGMTASR